MILLSNRQREEIRKEILKKYGCDLALSSDKHMIPIEGVNHWKTEGEN